MRTLIIVLILAACHACGTARADAVDGNPYTPTPRCVSDIKTVPQSDCYQISMTVWATLFAAHAPCVFVNAVHITSQRTIEVECILPDRMFTSYKTARYATESMYTISANGSINGSVILDHTEAGEYINMGVAR